MPAKQQEPFVTAARHMYCVVHHRACVFVQVPVFQQEHYLENFVQATFNAVVEPMGDEGPLKGNTSHASAVCLCAIAPS